MLARATVGAIVHDGKVVDCAPYVRRTWLGRDARDLWREQHRRGAHLEWIPDEPAQ